MKSCYLLLTLSLLLLAGPPPAKAQEEDAAPPPPERRRPGGPEFRGERGERPPRGGGPMKRGGERMEMQMLEQWLETLKQKEPEEYARLMALRENDAHAFRQELRKRRDRMVRERVLPSLERDLPKFRAYLESLPPDQRRAAVQKLTAGMHRKGDQGGRAPMGNPEAAKLEKATKTLAHQYHEAGEEEKPAIEEKLRSNLAELFDLRHKAKQAQVDHMERKLGELKTMLDGRRKNRDEIIERRFREMTGGDEMAW